MMQQVGEPGPGGTIGSVVPAANLLSINPLASTMSLNPLNPMSLSAGTLGLVATPGQAAIATTPQQQAQLLLAQMNQLTASATAATTAGATISVR